MEIGTDPKTLAMDEPVVKNKSKNILAKVKRNKNMMEAVNGQHIARARNLIGKMREDERKKNIEREKERAKKKIERKTKETQLLAKAKLDDFKTSNKNKSIYAR